LLKKLIKHGFRRDFPAFAVLFAAAIVFPVLVYFLAPDPNYNDWHYFWRGMAGSVFPVLTVIAAVIIGVLPFKNAFGDDGAYLMLQVPAKIRTHIAAYTIVFYVYNVLAVIFARFSAILANMSFVEVEIITENIIDRTAEVITRGSVQSFISLATEFISVLSIPLFIFGVVAAAVSVGHLCGTHKKAGKIIFTVTFFILGIFFLIGVQYVYNEVEFYNESTWNFSNSHIVRSAVHIFETLLFLGVTFAFYRFTDWVYRKRINVL
jgi:hypothetical protein